MDAIKKKNWIKEAIPTVDILYVIQNIYTYIYMCVCMSLWSNYAYLYTLGPLIDIEGRDERPSPGAPEAPAGQKVCAKRGAKKPPGATCWAQPPCLGPTRCTPRQEPPQATELRPGSAAGARNEHEQSFNYSLKATCIFHLTTFQTIIIISIGVQLQDCAFEILFGKTS